jgi:hypothetical protein
LVRFLILRVFCVLRKARQQERLSYSLGIFRAHERKELVARLLVVAEAAEHGAGHSLPMLFFDAAHLHAEVAGFDDHANAFGTDFFLNRRGDLAGEAFLDLQAAREHIDEARDFTQPDDTLVGKIGYVALAKER